MSEVLGFNLPPTKLLDKEPASAFLRHHSNLDVTDCSFLVTKAIPLADGSFEICAESTNLLVSGTWKLKYNYQIIYSTTGTNFCFTVPPGTSGNFILYFEAGENSCPQSFIIPSYGSNNCTPNWFSYLDPCPKTHHVTLNPLFLSNGLTNFVYKFNNGSPAVSTTNLDIDVPAGATQICITYQLPSEQTMTCCYDIPGAHCCNTADFEFRPNGNYPTVISRSCLNYEYIITPYCVGDENSVHIWEFEDGKKYIGAIPPSPYIFTDFVNSDDSVWIKHTVICCGDTLVTRKQAPHPNGAWLGLPEATRYMSQIIQWDNHPPISVKSFIQTYSGDPSKPLFIDGRLIVDIASTFIGGTWNMGKLAEINDIGQFFLLSATTIQSAARIGYLGCCSWKGIVSTNRTSITMSNSNVSDALVMLHYPSKSSFSQRPLLAIRNSNFLGNIIGFKVTDQNIDIKQFYGNSFVGIKQCLCGCNVANGFDFRGNLFGKLELVFPNIGAKNTIEGYEQGIHAENVKLAIYNIDVLDLDDFGTITLDGWNPSWENASSDDARIGIDYRWNAKTSSYLTLDNMRFATTNSNPTIKYVQTGIRERITAGTHSLTANANSLYNSIKMEQTNNGYDITAESTAILNGSIKGNTILTNGGLASEGIDVTVWTANNKMKIDDNNITINGGTNIGHGISLISLFDLQQNFVVENNHLNVGSTSNGNGIQVSNCKNSILRNNNLQLVLSKPGIEIYQGGSSTIECNYVQGGTIGLYLHTTPENRITSNHFYFNLENALRGQANCKGTNGSLIAYNKFDANGEYSVYYETGAYTGAQHHTGYNEWIGQIGVEVFSGNIFSSKQVEYSRFHRPLGAALFSINYPSATPINMMEDDTPAYPPLISASCNPNSNEPGNTEYFDNVPVANRYADFVADTSLSSSLTTAEYGHFKQTVMHLLIENPTWLTSNSVLNSFYNTEQNSFSGKSDVVRNYINALEKSIALQQNSLQGHIANLDSLSILSNQISLILDNTIDQDSINTLSAMMQNIDNQMDLINHTVDSLNTIFSNLNQITINNITIGNTALVCASDYQNWEKDLNGVNLKLLQNIALNTNELNEIRNVAMHCYKDGGRSVYMARNLSNIYLHEYYTDESCDQAPIQHRQGNETSAKALLSPNPANHTLNVNLDDTWSKGTIEIKILNAMGQTILTTKSEVYPKANIKIDVSGLSSGLYYVELKDNFQTATQKLMIAR